MRVKTLESLVKSGALKGKRVFIRSDLNAPRDENGNITNETRLVASVPAIRMARDAGARVMVVSHLGRPKEGEKTPADSLQKIAERMSELLGSPVRLIDNWVDGGFEVAEGEVVMLENCRCNVGEKKCSEELSKKYGALCDVFVNDAFGTAHRAQASTYGVAQYAETVCAGPLMAAEIEALTKAVEEAKHPLVAIVGGSKVSTKLTILNNLAQKVDQLIVGGGILNTFLLAAGYKIGKSLAEPDLVEECKSILKTLEAKNATLPMPTDVVVAKEFAENAENKVVNVTEVPEDMMILDIGPKSVDEVVKKLGECKTVIWNGPVGAFEIKPFNKATFEIAEAVAELTKNGLKSIGGGGDTVSALKKAGVADKLSYLSAAGGAFLEWMEGKTLPGVKVLEK